jgi:tetratricopeptide (TPR) repeat protein
MKEASPMAIDPDRLAQLEEERRFLLRSLSDLELERAVGDVDQHDYDVLRDGYTARAAAVLREIDDGKATLPSRRRVGRSVVGAWVVGVLAVAVLCGWLVARSSGQRIAGQSMTGGQAIDDVAASLAEARSLLQAGDFPGALVQFQQVTELEPDNAEARTYTAWLVVLTSPSLDEATRPEALDAALAAFTRVIADDPSYADPYCLSAVAAARFIEPPDTELAKERGEQCLANNPPSDMRGLIEQFLGSLVSPASPGSSVVDD